MLYLIIMLVCLILFLFQKKIKNHKLFFWAIIFFIFIVSAIRYNVGQDYQHWHEVYRWIKDGISAARYVEIGYRFLNIIFQYIPGHMYTLYATVSAFIVFGFGSAIYKNVKKEYHFLSLFLFLGTGVFFASLNLVRQYISIVMILLAFPYLIDKKYIKYLLCILLAGLFHTSSYIMIPFALFYMVMKKENSTTKKILVILYVLSIIFMIIDIRNVFNLIEFLIPYRWKWYLDSAFFNNRNYSAILKQVVPNVILIYSFTQIDKLKFDKKERMFFLLLFVNVFITNCFYGILVLLRLSYFFDLSLIFILPKLLEYSICKNKKFGIFCIVCVFIYYFLLTLVTIVIMNGHGVMPYDTIISLIQ